MANRDAAELRPTTAGRRIDVGRVPSRLSRADAPTASRRACTARSGTTGRGARAGAGGTWRAPARFYMAAQIETGHLCPITMTSAVGRGAACAAPTLAARMGCRGSLSRDYDPSFRPGRRKAGVTVGMGMTEKQGGTDVRANTTRGRARPATASTGSTGHKWFMSAPMCDAFLVLAQAPGGLTCFLMPRFLPGRQRQWPAFPAAEGQARQPLECVLGGRIRRCPCGCAGRRGGQGHPHHHRDGDADAARLRGRLGRADARRRWREARASRRHRTVFGKKLIDQPLMRSVLADMALDVEAATALVLRLCARLRPRRRRSAARRPVRG